jgi:C-terminal processing protease CtpA/Prc
MKKHVRALAFIAMGLFLIALTFTGHETSTNGVSISNTSAAANGAAVVRQTTPQQQSAEAFYHRVWELAGDNFLWQDRQQDWATWEHKFDGKLNTQADAERAVNQLLGNLNDPYTYFKDASLTASRGQASQATSVVSYKMLPNDIGYIRIRTFGSVHEADELEAALRALPKAKAFVIDLRDNGGGYVWQAFRSFALLADVGTFTTLKGRSGGAAYTEVLELRALELIDTENGKDTSSTRPDNVAGTRPIVILVNGDTASASEMLTGALRDNGRAKVVGTLSFGKGIAQNTWNLAGNTSVQITFAQYYFPSGSSIHKVGIKPDSVVGRSLVGDAQLDEAVRIAKDELKP